MKGIFRIAVFLLSLLLLTACLIYPAKTKTYFTRDGHFYEEFMYGVEIFAGVHLYSGNSSEISPYRLVLNCYIKNSICKTVSVEEVIVNKSTKDYKNKVEYRNNALFSITDYKDWDYDLPKEFNLDDMEDSTPIYISLKVKFELSDGSIKEEWLGCILYPRLRTRWFNPIFSV